mmetsp:Transcript_26386/g.87478  ORF Transcript_26386/g.87478 Transcript_26386/m.87478 type:complete len:302 (+) Transcript_26386:2044-2949(+)
MPGHRGQLLRKGPEHDGHDPGNGLVVHEQAELVLADLTVLVGVVLFQQLLGLFSCKSWNRVERRHALKIRLQYGAGVGDVEERVRLVQHLLGIPAHRAQTLHKLVQRLLRGVQAEAEGLHGPRRLVSEGAKPRLHLHQRRPQGRPNALQLRPEVRGHRLQQLLQLVRGFSLPLLGRGIVGPLRNLVHVALHRGKHLDRVNQACSGLQHLPVQVAAQRPREAHADASPALGGAAERNHALGDRDVAHEGNDVRDQRAHHEAERAVWELTSSLCIIGRRGGAAIRLHSLGLRYGWFGGFEFRL